MNKIVYFVLLFFVFLFISGYKNESQTEKTQKQHNYRKKRTPVKKEEKTTGINARNERGETKLHIAVNGYPKIKYIKALIQAGADVNVKDKYGKTPLHSALTSESPFDANITDILIIAGADVNVKDKYGETPLHFAAKHRDTEVTTILLNAGANVNDQTNVKENTWIGWTSLHFAACCNKNPEIITILIQAGGDINAQTKEGNTPLHIAAKSNINHHITIALIDSGANINAINKYHEDRHGIFYKATPLHLAVGGYNNELVAILFIALILAPDIN